MKYFLHDSNAFNDEKITELFIEHGYEGLGLFYTILEKLAGQEKPIKTSVLKHQLKVGKGLEKCWKFLESIGLISSNNGETFNEQLLNFSEKYQVEKEKNRKRISEWRENKRIAENVTRNEPVSNTPKVKVSKVKLKEIDNVPIVTDYDSFIDLMKKYTGRSFRGDGKSRTSFDARMKHGYTLEDFETALKNVQNDDFHKGNGYKYITPEFMTREDKLTKFLAPPVQPIAPPQYHAPMSRTLSAPE